MSAFYTRFIVIAYSISSENLLTNIVCLHAAGTSVDQTKKQGNSLIHLALHLLCVLRHWTIYLDRLLIVEALLYICIQLEHSGFIGKTS